MANRYWVGGTGNWTDNANHWSRESGGSPGASLPTSLDNVFFDANSFTGTNQIVTVNATANCKSMDWSGALYNPTLTGSYGMYIYGSLIFAPGMTSWNSSTITFASTTTGNTINTNGVAIVNASIDFNGVGGEWTLESNFVNGTGSSNKIISLTNGAFYTNGYNIAARGIYSSNTNSRKLDITNSTITLTSPGNIISWNFQITTNLTFIGTGSTIIYNGTSSTRTFYGGGFTYNIIEWYKAFTISGNNTINNLIFHYDGTNSYKITAGSTQKINTMSGEGTEGNLIPLYSTINGNSYTLNISNNNINVLYYSIQDCAVTGGGSFNAYNSTNVSNNSGVNFASITLPSYKTYIRNKRIIKTYIGTTDISKIYLGTSQLQ